MKYCYLFIYIKTGEINTFTINHINELINRRITPEYDLSIMYLILVEHLIHRLSIYLRQGDRAIERQPSRRLWLEVYVRPPLVQPDPQVLQLLCQQPLLDLPVLGVQHHEDHVRRPRCGDDLAPAPLALGGTLDDPGKVQQLDLGPVVLEDPGDAGQGGEFVGADRGGRGGDLAEQGGLAHAGEADHGNPGVPLLLDLEAVPLGGALCHPVQKLGPVLGEMRFEHADVMLGTLVALGACDLCLDLFDFVCDAHLIFLVFLLLFLLSVCGLCLLLVVDLLVLLTFFSFLFCFLIFSFLFI